ncbi:hypothetical protein NBG4_250026 [Candidatus Sulfobium mesophilum]|uniref:Uncharacterized protein n=1 Tax=Candidatus Sulfobium mesophilum TaxID=2016548 RepID=A0A2U3QGE7_9BACT|nr:hypothetical protein NBG4_250026 [Candidatus Sulfobium mesophilum]
MGISNSAKKTSSIASPFFYSLALHLSLISIILALPVHSGSLNPLSLGSLFLYLRNDDSGLLEKSAADPEQDKTTDLRTAHNINERKTDEVLMSKMSPGEQEKTIASKTFNAEDEKNHITPPPEAKPIQENNPESLESMSLSSQIRGTTVEDQPKAGEAKGWKVEVITKEKPAMSASNSSVTEFFDTVKPARIVSRAAKSDDDAGRNISARDNALEEKPFAPQPFQKTVHDRDLKEKALPERKGQGQGKQVMAKKVAIEKAGPQGYTGAGMEGKSQDRDERHRNTVIAKASGTTMEIPSGGGSTPLPSQQLTSAVVKPAHPASVESGMKTELTQQADDAIHKDRVDKKESAQPDRREAGIKDEKFGFGFPKVEVPQSEDVKVEVNLDGRETQSVFIHLAKKPYPSPGQRVYKSKQGDVKCAAETKEEDLGASGIRHIFSIVKADHGIYTFTIDNKGNEIHVATIAFRLYEGQERERIKEYKNVQIQPGAVLRFKFIVPDAIFWDDKDRFSGEIESSKSMTKFNGSGLIWIEDKD